MPVHRKGLRQRDCSASCSSATGKIQKSATQLPNAHDMLMNTRLNHRRVTLLQALLASNVLGVSTAMCMYADEKQASPQKQHV
jgi:hypothetical protein